MYKRRKRKMKHRLFTLEQKLKTTLLSHKHKERLSYGFPYLDSVIVRRRNFYSWKWLKYRIKQTHDTRLIHCGVIMTQHPQNHFGDECLIEAKRDTLLLKVYLFEEVDEK